MRHTARPCCSPPRWRSVRRAGARPGRALLRAPARLRRARRRRWCGRWSDGSDGSDGSAGTDGSDPGHAPLSLTSTPMARPTTTPGLPPTPGAPRSPIPGEPGVRLRAALRAVRPGSYLRVRPGPLLVEAEGHGHQLVFRPYIDYPGQPSGLPEHLVGGRPRALHGARRRMVPDYTDPDLKEAILDFIAAFGAAYDGDPRLGVVQLGLLGFWGEWHTWPHSDWFADAQLQSDVMAAYTDAFSTTLLQVRYASTTSAGLRLGYHDDSFAYSTVGDIDWFFVPQLERAGATERWAAVPIGGELRPELQTEVFEPTPPPAPSRTSAVSRDPRVLPAQLRRLGFDSGGVRARPRAPGPWLRPAPAADLGPQVLTLIQNDGVAPFLPLRVR